FAQAHPDSDVDVQAASMLVGVSNLAADWDHAHVQVLAALAAVAARHDVDYAAYEAACMLAGAADSKKDYETEQTAWEAAIVHAQGADADPRVAEANAKTSLAGTIVLKDHNHFDQPALLRAAGLLLEAKAELWPLAQLQGPNDSLTIAQSAFARASAWTMVP